MAFYVNDIKINAYYKLLYSTGEDSLQKSVRLLRDEMHQWFGCRVGPGDQTMAAINGSIVGHKP